MDVIVVIDLMFIDGPSACIVYCLVACLCDVISYLVGRVAKTRCVGEIAIISVVTEVIGGGVLLFYAYILNVVPITIIIDERLPKYKQIT